MAKKLSANSIKNLLLAGQTVKVNKYAIKINEDDDVEIWPPKGRGFAASLLHLDTAVKQFMKLADLDLPGEINQSMGDAVKVPDNVLGDDTTTDEPFDVPEINEQVKPDTAMSSTDLGKDTTTKNPFENPAVNKRPKSDWGLPDTDLGSDSSTDGGFEVPKVNKRPQIPDVKMSDTSLKSYAKKKRGAFMEPQVWEGDFVLVNEKTGGGWIEKGYEQPEDTISEELHGWGAKMSAPGFLDQKYLVVFDTEEEAIDYLFENYMTDMGELDEEYEEYRDIYNDYLKRKGWDKESSKKISDTFSQEKSPSVYKEIRANRPSKQLLDGILDEDAWTAKMTLGKLAGSDPFKVEVNDRPNQIDQKMSDPELSDEAEDSDVKEELDKRRFNGQEDRTAVAPPGEKWERLVKELKDNPGVDNPYAVAWSQYNESKEAQKRANGFLANLWDQWMAGKRSQVLATLKKLGSDEVTKVFVSSLPEKEQKNLLKQAQDYSQMSLDQIIADLDSQGLYDPNMTLQQLMDTYGQQQVAAKKRGQFDDEGYGGRVEELVESWINGNRKDVIEEILQDTTLALEVYDALPESERQVFKMLRSIKMGKANTEVEPFTEMVNEDTGDVLHYSAPKWGPLKGDPIEEIPAPHVKGSTRKQAGSSKKLGSTDSLFEEIMNYESMYNTAMELANSYKNVRVLAKKLKDAFGPQFGVSWTTLAQDVLDMAKPATEVEPLTEEDTSFKEGCFKQAGPKLREKWDDKGGYNRDIEAESAEELHALVNGLAGEDVDWSIFRKDMVNDVQEEANPDGEPEGMVVAKKKGQFEADYQKYLGTMDVSEFEYKEEIEDYFSKGNLIRMFGPDEYNEEEAKEAMYAAIDAWTNQRMNQDAGYNYKSYQARNCKAQDKEAVDEKAKDYYGGYFGEYGKELAGDKSVTDKRPKGKDKKEVKAQYDKFDDENIYEEKYNIYREDLGTGVTTTIYDRPLSLELAKNLMEQYPEQYQSRQFKYYIDIDESASEKKLAQAAPMPEEEPMPAPQAPAPGGAPAPKAPGAPAPGGAAPKAVQPKPKNPAQPDPGMGNDGLMALGWTQEEIELMDPEDKSKILSAQIHKPGTKPKKAPKPAPAGQTPAPGGAAPQAPAQAPAGPPAAPAGQPAPAPAQPKPMTPAASRKFAKQLLEKLRVRKAQQMLQQEVPVTDVETQQPQRVNLTPGQPKPQAPGSAPATPAAPAEPGTEPMSLSDESQAYRMVQEIQMQQIQASSPEQVPIAKASILAERLIEIGMTISEAKKLFGVQSLSALFK